MARSGSKAENKKAAKGRGEQAKRRASLRANEALMDDASFDVEPLVDGGASRDIAGVVLAVVAVASFIAVITPASAPVTQAISSFYHLGFGLGAYVLPLALLAIAALMFLRDRAPVPPRTCIGAVVIFVAVISMLSLSVPMTSLSTAAMFEPDALASSGGYIGAFVASSLQGALGKPISYVILIGLVVLGLVIIGFSIGDLVREASERARELAARRHVDVNESPWGDADALVSAQDVAAAPRRKKSKPASRLFNVEDDAETTYLGDREKTTLLVDDDADDIDEDPFVDVSAQVEAEEAKTRLIPIKEKHASQVDEVEAIPPAAGSTPAPVTGLDVIHAAADSIDKVAPVIASADGD